MVKSKINLKVVVTTILVLALVACLGISAFAENTAEPGTTPETSQSTHGMNGPHDKNDRPDDFDGEFGYCPFGGCGFDDYYDMFGYDFGFGYGDEMDIDEILANVDDEDLKAEIQKLYDEYIDATEKAETAQAALEDCLEENGLLPGYDEDYAYAEEEPVAEDENAAPAAPETDTAKGAADDDAAADAAEEDKVENEADDMDAMFQEFLKWYKSNKADI